MPQSGRPIAASALADGDMGSYDSAEAAAIAGLRSIQEQDRELGGGILYNAGTQKYAYTQPIGQGDGGHFAARVQVPQGWRLQALYHSHPKGQDSTVFSDDDVNMSTQLKVPSYILPRADDQIRRFDPASSRVVGDPMNPSAKRYSLGSVVNETPIDTQSVGYQRSHATYAPMPGSSPQALAQALAQQTGVK